MSNHQLKLTGASDEPSETFRLERRSEGRNFVSGRVTGVIGKADLYDGDRRVAAMQLLNMSPSGVGAIAQEPIELGRLVTLFLPPHGPEHGLDLCGRVVRCERKGYGYEVGIRLAQKMAA